MVTKKANRYLHAQIKYQKKNKKKIAEYQFGYRMKNKEELNKYAIDRYDHLRHSVLMIYSNGTMKCSCKGCNNRDLVIEHVKGKKSLGHQNMSNPSYYMAILHDRPKNLKVSCQECNASKRDTGHCRIHN